MSITYSQAIVPSNTSSPLTQLLTEEERVQITDIALRLAELVWRDDSQAQIRDLLFQYVRAALRVKEPPTLAHYTTFVGVQGIVEADTIWANDITKQSDATEAQYGQQLIIDATRAAPQDTRIHNFREAITRVIAAPVVSAHAYSTSLSLHEDIAEQWRRYGDWGRGYSIVVDTTKINKTVNLLSLRVLYDRDEQRVVIQTLVRALEIMLWRIRHTRGFISEEIGKNILTEVTTVLHLFFVPAMKAAHFSSEREWRYVATEWEGQDHINLPPSVHGGPSRRDLLLTSPAGISPIVSIRSGPCASPDNTEILRQLLNAKGLSHVQIVPSDLDCSRLCP